MTSKLAACQIFSSNPKTFQGIQHPRRPSIIKKFQLNPPSGNRAMAKKPFSGSPTDISPGSLNIHNFSSLTPTAPHSQEVLKNPQKKFKIHKDIKVFGLLSMLFQHFSGKISIFRILSPTSHTAHNMPHMIPHVMEKT